MSLQVGHGHDGDIDILTNMQNTLTVKILRHMECGVCSISVQTGKLGLPLQLVLIWA